MVAELSIERRLPQLALVAACAMAVWVAGTVVPLVQFAGDGARSFGNWLDVTMFAVASVPVVVAALDVVVLLLVAGAPGGGRADLGRVAAALVGIVAGGQALAQLALAVDAAVGRGWISSWPTRSDRAVIVGTVGCHALLLGAIAWWGVRWAVRPGEVGDRG